MSGLVDSRKKFWVKLEGSIVKWLFMSCALVSILTTLGILVILLYQGYGFFKEIGIWEFLTGTRWTPILKPRSYGVLPLVSGTLIVTVIAALVALPIGLMTAIFLAEYAAEKVRRIIKPILEILAGIPTVVYGYFALTFVTPLLQNVISDLLIFNALSAGLVMGIMIIPMVSSLSEDAMISVPRNLREAAYALGATRYEVSLRVVVPAALSGIMASFIIALSRAIGETMLVTIAAGATPKMTLNRAFDQDKGIARHSNLAGMIEYALMYGEKLVSSKTTVWDSATNEIKEKMYIFVFCWAS